MVVIVDYDMGNLGSIQNMIKKIGYDSVISNDRNEILKADKLILPGVGRFDIGMKKLYELEIIDVLDKMVIEDKTPILGICLGMQILTSFSEEGNAKGLGWIEGETLKFSFGNASGLKVPHMGWDYINYKYKHKIFSNMYEELRFYFVHSYYVNCKNHGDVLAETKYGVKFHSIIGRDNIIGTQFHPEKSHKYGMQILKNFLELY